MKGWEWWHTVAAIAVVLWLLNKATTVKAASPTNRLTLPPINIDSSGQASLSKMRTA